MTEAQERALIALLSAVHEICWTQGLNGPADRLRGCIDDLRREREREAVEQAR